MNPGQRSLVAEPLMKLCFSWESGGGGLGGTKYTAVPLNKIKLQDVNLRNINKFSFN